MNLNFIAGIGYVAFIVGVACNSIGTTFEKGTYSWRLPITVLIVMGVPFCLGFFAGRQKK